MASPEISLLGQRKGNLTLNGNRKHLLCYKEQMLVQEENRLKVPPITPIPSQPKLVIQTIDHPLPSGSLMVSLPSHCRNITIIISVGFYAPVKLAAFLLFENRLQNKNPRNYASCTDSKELQQQSCKIRAASHSLDRSRC